MSFWAKVKTAVRDLNVFQEVCKRHNVEYTEVNNMQHRGYDVHAVLQDKNGRSQAFLVHDGGAFRMLIDNDAWYSTLTKRLGQNGGTMMRDYTTGVVEKQVRNQGGTITNRIQNPDGSVVLKVAMAAG